ncbi:hypothetical protein TIFTF001_007364 [Ficus carica]|uniref:indole-3-pyruvate monooxygenase n=1 Tax=Ficus carica TaxID=3494 RepID=A0AA87ZR48_FICCA|nr:hypothetical protein TIFTF001_007364 [Ficus carica]
MKQETVIIVGAGPSGLATAACLTKLCIPYIVLEREDCHASLWNKYSYDRLHFHLQKQFCNLPHMPFPSYFPTYLPKKLFTQYLADYVSRFAIAPLYRRSVESASFDPDSRSWVVRARIVGGAAADNGHGCTDEIEEYSARFLVVATGETANPFVPEIRGGLSGFSGDVLHSVMFKNGKEFKDKRVLVVGAGNSGMEIALDLANHGAKTSIIVRSPVHVLSRGMVYLALVLLKHLPLGVVDFLMVILSKLVYGNLTKYGMKRPTEGPFLMKVKYGKYPVIDVGTCDKIRTGEIQVLPAEIESVKGSDISLKNGKSYQFDAIVFCTGFKRSTHLWLKGDDYLLNDDGIPKPSFPDHWRGKNGLYCVGLSRRGFYGAKSDAENIANDIKSVL